MESKTITVETQVEIVRRIESDKSRVYLILNGTDNKEPIQLTATYSNGETNDITSLATWTSSNENVADVIKGVIIGYESGTTTLTAKYGTKTTTITVDVDKTLQLEVDKQSVFLSVNGTYGEKNTYS